MYAFGWVDSGLLLEDQAVILMPKGHHIVISKLFDIEEVPLKYALPGEYIKMKVTNIEHTKLA